MSEPIRTFRKSPYVQVPCCPKCDNRLQDGECDRCRESDPANRADHDNQCAKDLED